MTQRTLSELEDAFVHAARVFMEEYGWTYGEEGSVGINESYRKIAAALDALGYCLHAEPRDVCLGCNGLFGGRRE